jgi:hypothetical protein
MRFTNAFQPHTIATLVDLAFNGGLVMGKRTHHTNGRGGERPGDQNFTGDFDGGKVAGFPPKPFFDASGGIDMDGKRATFDNLL